MKFLMIARSVPGAPPPTPAQMAEIGQFTAEMVKSGAVVLTGGMVRPTTGIQIQNAAGKISITDGPFAETKELIDGFAIVEVKSKEEAIAHRDPLHEDRRRGQGEILRIFEAQDIPALAAPARSAGVRHIENVLPRT